MFGCGGGKSSTDNPTPNTGDSSGSGGDSNSGDSSSSGDDSNAGDNAGSVEHPDISKTGEFPFGYQTGKITFEIKSKLTSSASSGFVETKGEEEWVFEKWGNTQRREENSSTFVSTIPATDTNHRMILFRENDAYTVSFKESEITHTDMRPIYLIANAVLDKIKDKDDNYAQKGGADIVLGYACTNYTIPVLGEVICWHKGVPLRTTISHSISSDGTTTFQETEIVAKKINFNVALTEGDLDLPDFPVVNGAQINPSNPSAESVLYNVNVSVDSGATSADCPTGEATIIIKNDVITGIVVLDDGTGSYNVQGQIDLEDNIQGGFVFGGTRVADFAGKRTSTGISGTWSANANCFGSFASY